MDTSTITFAGIGKRWADLRRRGSSRRPSWDDEWVGQAFIDLFSPDSRMWFTACVNELHHGEPDEVNESHPAHKLVGELLESKISEMNVFGKMAQAHLAVCKAMANHRRTWAEPDKSLSRLPESELKIIANEANVAEVLISRLAEEMSQDPSGRANRSVSLTVPIVETIRVRRRDKVEDVEEGTLATLTLELLPDGTGELCPSPAMAFVDRDSIFQHAELDARAYLRNTVGIWRDQQDVSWTFSRPGNPLPLKIGGPSAGGGFAMGLAKLLAE